ncbi:MAG: glycerophosphodiester phosphodiesterase [Bryobacteraceae bacterium]|nr:glycerophosphodiester phosphodiesterase [Bryobacteraceae bacterium]
MGMAGEAKIQVHGHRGARTVLPENTIPAFEHAIAAGADFIELDVSVTKDDVVIVNHDLSMNRAICQGPEGETAIRKLTLAQIKQWDCGVLGNKDFPRQKTVPGTRVPTLEEVLALAPKGSFHFNIELKMDAKRPELTPARPAFARMVVDAVKKHRLEKRVLLQSFDLPLMAELKKLVPDWPLAALYAGLPRDYPEISAEAGGMTMVNPHYALVTKDQVQKAHAAGLKVAAWTANSAEVWDKLIDAGVDGIITDDPAALVAHLKAKGLR